MADRSIEGVEVFERVRSLLAGPDDAPLRAFLADLHAADVADCLEQVEEEQRSRILFLLPPRTCAEAIVLLEDAVRSDVLDDLTDQEVSDVLKELPADDAVDVLDELDDDVADKVVEQLPPEQKAAVEPLRMYDESSAGGIMDPNFVSVSEDALVADAIEEIRQVSPEDTDNVFYIYCVDDGGMLKGVVPPMRLLTARQDMPVKSQMHQDLITVHVNDDQEKVKNKFDKYDVVALPVVDDDNRMLGIITHDDVLEIAEEEAEEDIYYMAGTQADEFASPSIFHAASVRARWLLPCLVGTFVAAGILFVLQPKLGAFKVIVFPFIIPIAAMGGNAGVQISTVIVRALATGDAMAGRLRNAAAREFRIAAIVGVSSGILAGLFSQVYLISDLVPAQDMPPDPPIAMVGIAVASSMTLAILAAGSLGVVLPFLCRRLGIDPAIATGPLITTVNDALSAFIFLEIAIALLPASNVPSG